MSEVERYYDEQVQYEWERLERHRTELAVTLRALDDYLPRPPAAILDVGGGPGRYAVALAERGYAVTLVDLSARMLAFAEDRARALEVELAGSVRANAVNLAAFVDASFDAVLLMGPLYHLLGQDERDLALREARRVLKPGGVIFAAFITRYASIRDVAKHRPHLLVANRERYEHVLSTGLFIGPGEVHAFTDAYLAHPAEVRPWLEAAGFETLDLIAAEGIVDGIGEGVNALSGDAWEAWVDLNYRLGRDPSVHGAASHLLYVGRKQPS